MGLSWWSILFVFVGLVELGFRMRGSVGKALLGLEIDSMDRKRYYIRETIGKLASTLTFGIGFVLILTKNRLALHDYIAGTRVVTARQQSRSFRIAIVVLVMLAVGTAAYLGYRVGRAGGVPQTQSSGFNLPEAVVRQSRAVLTIYGFDSQDNPELQGSGFLVSPEGLSVTNYHVLSKVYRGEAKLDDARIFQILVVHAYDEENDLALFQLGRVIEGKTEWPKDLPYLALGSSDGIRVGEHIAAITSPEGLSNTVTEGIVSSIRQDEIKRLIQITAPISEGSSGGPILDIKGNVIGIAVAQIGEGQNLNFAVPVEKLRPLLARRDGLSLAAFRKVIVPAVDQGDAYRTVFELGVDLLDSNRYTQALKSFLQAEKLQPDEPNSYYNAAICYQLMGDDKSAAVHYSVYLALAPAEDPDREKVASWLKSHGRSNRK
jgi:S1-C subfamily serine protease